MGDVARRHCDDYAVDPLAGRTLELVDIPSVSGEEAAIVDHVRALLPGPPVYDDDTVLFYPGRIVLAGHYDTVPAQENLPGRIEDGWVVGLGSTDMKGGVAVMIELARAGAPFGYLFFGREELPAGESALPRFFERHGLDADLVVMLEPTDDSIHAGCLGNLNARLVFHGTSAHSARPWTGDNAIARAVEGLAPIVTLEPRDVEIQGLVFREVLSVTGIEGGIATNVIPDRAVATLELPLRAGPHAGRRGGAVAAPRGWCGRTGAARQLAARARRGRVAARAGAARGRRLTTSIRSRRGRRSPSSRSRGSTR